jgi:hypothetical protein
MQSMISVMAITSAEAVCRYDAPIGCIVQKKGEMSRWPPSRVPMLLTYPLERL